MCADSRVPSKCHPHKWLTLSYQAAVITAWTRNFHSLSHGHVTLSLSKSRLATSTWHIVKWLKWRCNSETRRQDTRANVTSKTGHYAVTRSNHRTPSLHPRPVVLNLASNLGQIGPKWDKSEAFSGQISVHLAFDISDLKKPRISLIWGQFWPKFECWAWHHWSCGNEKGTLRSPLGHVWSINRYY